ncbi:tetratricopeptide repeat protein [bacterium]|nr:tetratricopeptide repeat protein [bacterium]
MMRHKNSWIPLFLFMFIVLFPLFIFSSAFALDRTAQGEGGELILTKADSLFLKNNLPEAIQALDSLINAYPDNDVYLYNRGLLEQEVGRSRGEEWFTRAYQKNPRNKWVLWRLGQLELEQGRLEQAINHLVAALEIDKSFYECQTDLGKCLRLIGKPEEAIAYLKDAIKERPTYIWATVELAYVYMQLGQNEKAKEVLRTSYSSFPYAEILYELIHHFQQSDQQDSVAIYSQKYLDLYPIGPHAAELESYLTDLTDGTTSYHSDISELLQNFEEPVSLPLNKRLKYKVKYGPLTLGYLDVEVMRGESDSNRAWRMQYIIRTANGVPFFTIQDTFEVYMRQDMGGSSRILMKYYENEYRNFSVYETDWDKGVMVNREVNVDGSWYVLKQISPDNTFDPSSAMWITQQLVRERRSAELAIQVSGGYEKAVINVIGPDKTLDLAGQQWTDSIYLDGILRYSGISGLTGGYEGWYSNDDMTIPLISKFKILLGSVRTELIGIEELTDDEMKEWKL